MLDVITTWQRQLESAQRQLTAAQQRIAELEKQAGGPAAPATTKVEEPFSMRAEEKRQQARHKKKRKPSRKSRRGRLSSADKIKLAEGTETGFPEGVPPGDCQRSPTRPLWRLENGRAVWIAYQIYRGPQKQYGKIPGVLGCSDFGLEIVAEIAYFV